MRQLSVSGVIFDLDDTLMPELDYVRSGYAHVSRLLSDRLSVPAPRIEQDLWTIFRSPDRSRAYNRLLELYGVSDPALVRDCIRSYRAHLPEVSLSDADSKLLDWCLSWGPVGVVTDGPRVMQAAKAQALGLTERGIQVVLSDDLGGRVGWKPSPAGMLEACRRMEICPDRAVYVGDNPAKDFIAAHAAGMHAIRFRTRGQLHHAVEPAAGAEADIEISSLQELRSILRFERHH
ncbi:putative hydrolase of the HAD superfamily [Agrococcus baldri]|uniref:Hydrolase of the HAD superfamily n=1 Tax=Agrococcus baldri TaxID=153730 RepID=A0AA94KYM7_9MICO|nr:HAD family hydrolase [Agrococcus baldri]SFS00283.1 putative hydrolase of the HAD superfamily [Agrococcus baldri]